MRAILPLALTLATTASADVWIVDESGGGDFLDLPPAVAAAADGDTLIVHAGTYSGFALDAKGLTIVGAAGARPVIVELVTIDDLPADSCVVLSNLEIVPPAVGSALRCEDCVGALRLVDCRIEGLSTWLGFNAVELEDCDDVAVTRCLLQGGAGIMDVPFPHGGSGVSATYSTLSISASQVSGGDGGDSSDYAGDGGMGLYSRFGFVYASGCQFVRGEGGKGFQTDGTDGRAVWVVDEGWLQDNDYGGGQTVGDLTFLPGPARTLGSPSTAPAASVMSVQVTGPPGNEVHVVASFDPGFRFLRWRRGVRLTSLPEALLASGTIPAGGTLTLLVPTPGVAPGEGARVIHLQSVAVNPAGRLLQGHAAELVVLRP